MRDVEAEAAAEKVQANVGRYIKQLEQGGGLGGLEGGVLTGFTVRMPTEADPGVLVVVKASGAEGPVVAFVGAYTLERALLAWKARNQAGRMKWREDVPYEQRGRG